VTIVSFSGIDGAGKSTQISELQLWLHQSGLSTKLVTFWDDIVVLCRLREYMSHRSFKGDQGIGSPEKPLQRRDKNVTSLPVTASRFFFYFADALSLAIKAHKPKSSQADVVIFDRYIYDELANLPMKSRLVRAFIWLTLKLVPKPDVSYIIDADPAAAIARKPEYPLDFLHRNRQAYLNLSKLAGNITVIQPASIEAMQADIRAKMVQALPARNGRSPHVEAQRIPVNH
jgi:thymidylate kinase